MRRVGIIFIALIIASVNSFGQEKDSANGIKVDLEEVLVSATLTKKRILEIPAQVDLFDSKEIENFPLNNIDDILKTSANINVNRSWGIFSKNSSVTMRGLEGSSRVLVLIDGVPKNKLGGGSVNWHNINPETIEKIEVIKGPASSIYGNNAMGGVINIITKKPTEKLKGSVEGFVGSYGTLGALSNISGSDVKSGRGLYWNINSFYRKGDGYIFEAPDFLDETDVPTWLKEYGGGGMVGYQLNEDNTIDFSFDYFDEDRGSGRQVFLEKGSFEAIKTRQFKLRYSAKVFRGDLRTILYFNSEDYFGQKESLNDFSEYRLLDSYSIKNDMGFWSVYSRVLPLNNRLTIGVEGKSGSIDGDDIYRTSPDLISYKSKMDILGLFIQDEIDLYKNKLMLIGGIRTDLVRFYDGFQGVYEPSSVTGFLNGFEEVFEPNSWTALSPKLALRYNVSGRTGLYASYSVGFMPPGLKDLAQTGKIRKGFRIANPALKPEYLTNYEIGFNTLLGDNISLNSAIYYSDGRDFQYMVNTGDSIDTGGNSLKPVMRPENIGRVGIKGGEISLVYYFGQRTKLSAGYSYNDSELIEFDSDANKDQNLAGNKLVEVSPHLFYANLYQQNKYFSLNLNCTYVGEQWFDDQNTILIDDYFLINLRISKLIIKNLRVYTDIQNILDNEYVDRKGQLNPGRYITAGVSYGF